MKKMRLGVIMDDIATIHYHKDSTFAMLWEAQQRGWEVFYFLQKDVSLLQGEVFGKGFLLTLKQDPQQWFTLKAEQMLPLGQLDILLMRKDPPFNAEYIYTTYLLEHVERQGVLVVNRPQALRDANEKLFTTYFPQCTPPAIVTQSIAQLAQFRREQGIIVCKPLDSMGGTSVFYVNEQDINAPVIFAMLTANESRFVMAQRFIPEIKAGDKRIILVNGKPIPYALARIPSQQDWRGNLAVGAKGKVAPLTPKDEWICEQIGPTLREKGLYFVGIDVIGDYLTEINVTSPTGIREIDAGASINIAQIFLDELEALRH